jgi:hypothetical protein
MKSGKLKIALLFLLSATTLISCIPQKKWEKATITFNDKSEREAYVYASSFSYYNFFRAKYSLDERRIIYPPNSVKSVSNDNFAYNSLFFDEERFGMESYGFIKRLAGKTLYVGVSKFKMKTCACKTSGGYFKGYFVVHGDNYIKVSLDVKNHIKNINELNAFIESEGVDFEIPQSVSNLDELISIIDKVGI